MARLVAAAAEAPPQDPVLETDVSGAQDIVLATAPNNKLRALFGTKVLKFLARLRIIGYGIDDQADPAIHPFFDSEGSQKVRFGGRLFSRDKKYTAGAAANCFVDLTPKAGSPIELLSFLAVIGGTKATAAAFHIKLFSENDVELLRLATIGSGAANNPLNLPAPGELQNAADKTGTSEGLVVHSPDKVRVQLDTVALNELYIIRQRWLVHGPDDPAETLQADLTAADE